VRVSASCPGHRHHGLPRAIRRTDCAVFDDFGGHWFTPMSVNLGGLYKSGLGPRYGVRRDSLNNPKIRFASLSASSAFLLESKSCLIIAHSMLSTASSHSLTSRNRRTLHHSHGPFSTSNSCMVDLILLIALETSRPCFFVALVCLTPQSPPFPPLHASKHPRPPWPIPWRFLQLRYGSTHPHMGT